MLVVNRKLRVTDNIDEEDVSDFQLDLFFGLGMRYFDVSFGMRVARISPKRESLRNGSRSGLTLS